MVDNSTEKQRQDFKKGAVGIFAMRYARMFADAKKQGNLYKKIYQLVFEYE